MSIKYNSFKKGLLDGEFDFSSDTTQEFRISLHTSSYIPSVDGHSTMNDVTNEIIGIGYSTGGETLTSIITSIDVGTDRVYLGADDITWPNSSITARYGVIYRYVDGTPLNNPLIACIDFVTDQHSSQDVFTISWFTGKILFIT